MTLLERDERMREEGRKEGRKEGKEIANLNSIKNLMETLDISAENAMDLVKIPAEEREKYREKLQ
jgi:predicted transposase YdaD